MKRRHLNLPGLLGFLIVFLWAEPAQSGQQPPGKAATEIQVAAAADLQFAMDELRSRFEREHAGISVRVTFGSSGNFYSQLLNQAPFDIFFSADLEYPRKLMEQGFALQGSQFSYAVGRLALWTLKSSPIDLGQLEMEALRHQSVRHIAIANPKHAPYGKAAEAALRASGMYEVLKDNLVYGENVAQALQFVESGAAEIGMIAYSLTRAPGVRGKGQFWEVPSRKFPRMEQSGIILRWARDPDAARAFRSFVLGPKGRAVLVRYGFNLPGE